MSSRRPTANDTLNIHARPSLAPVASPVSTFVRPTLKESRGETLSRALETIDSLNPSLKREFKRQADVELAEGEEMFEDKREDYAEAVRSGSIPAGASPFVRRGYRTSQLHTLAASYSVELNRAMESSNIHEEDDPAKVEAFIREFTASFEEANGVDGMPAKEVDKFYRPTTIRAQDAFRTEQAERNISLIEERRIRSFEAELLANMQMSRGRDISGWINAKAQEMYEEGIDHSVIEKTIMNAVGTYAMERGSVGIASMLRGVQVAGMPALGSSVAGRKVITQIREKAAAAEQARAKRAAAAETKARKARVQSLEVQIAQAYINGDEDTQRELVGELATLDGSKAYTWHERADRQEDALDEADLEANAQTIISAAIELKDQDAARDMASEALAVGHLTPEAFLQLDSIMAKVDPDVEDDPIPSVLEALGDDPNYSSIQRSLDDLIRNEGFGRSASVEQRDKGFTAKRHVQRDAVAWMQQNRDPETGDYDQLAFQDFLYARHRFYRDTFTDPSEYIETDALDAKLSDPQAMLPPSAR